MAAALAPILWPCLLLCKAKQLPCLLCLGRLRRPAQKPICPVLYQADAFKAAGGMRFGVAERCLVMGKGPPAAGSRQGAHAGRWRCWAAKATGLTLDLTGKGLGLRSARYSMLVRDARWRLNVETVRGSPVSDAATLLAQIIINKKSSC